MKRAGKGIGWTPITLSTDEWKTIAKALLAQDIKGRLATTARDFLRAHGEDDSLAQPLKSHVPAAKKVTVGGLGENHDYNVDILCLDGEMLVVVNDTSSGQHDYTFPRYYSIDYCQLATDVVHRIERESVKT